MGSEHKKKKRKEKTFLLSAARFPLINPLSRRAHILHVPEKFPTRHKLELFAERGRMFLRASLIRSTVHFVRRQHNTLCVLNHSKRVTPFSLPRLKLEFLEAPPGGRLAILPFRQRAK